MRTIQEIETRKAQILEEMSVEGVAQEKLDALKKEMDELREEAEAIRKAAQDADETRKAIAAGAAGIPVSGVTQGEVKPVGDEEVRKSAAYVNAFVKYIKTGDDKECRSLLTENAADGGQVPVPVLVDDIVRHAWENENVLARVKKTGFKGNVKVAFERAADPAYIHGEGTSAPTEEALTLGIVTIKPENIKKWITLSDEMMEETGEGFLRYVYEELAYQVMKKLSAEVVGDVVAAGTSHTSSAVGIPKVNKDPAILTIAEAAANLSDEATSICVVMNRLTEIKFQEAYAAGNFAIDPFAGLPRVYTSALPSFDTADANATYAIVGDLTAIQVNFPAGEGLKIIEDKYSLAERDLVKIVGRVFAGHEVTAPGRLVRLTKEASAVTT